MPFCRFVLLARDMRRSRENDNNCERRPKIEWPYVMNSFVAMHRPLVSGPGFGTISMHLGITVSPNSPFKIGLTSRLQVVIANGQRLANWILVLYGIKAV